MEEFQTQLDERCSKKREHRPRPPTAVMMGSRWSRCRGSSGAASKISLSWLSARGSNYRSGISLNMASEVGTSRWVVWDAVFSRAAVALSSMMQLVPTQEWPMWSGWICMQDLGDRATTKDTLVIRPRQRAKRIAISTLLAWISPSWRLIAW